MPTSQKVDQQGVVVLVTVLLSFLCTYLTSEQTGGCIKLGHLCTF